MTLHYDFPSNITFDEVKKLVEDKKEFVIAYKDNYIVVNYLMAGKRTHPIVIDNDRNAAILRELRGLIFHKDTGEVIARRFHKFFNFGEREDVMEVDLSKPHVILEKLDGSMITPFIVDGELYWGTKMGKTDISHQIEHFIVENPNYELMAKQLLQIYNCTPIFEWCSNKNRIVIDYPQDRLVLTAIRANTTGSYMPYEPLSVAAETFNVELVKKYPGTIESMENLVKETRALTDKEGWVIRFDDGHMVKLKADQYVAMHRAKDSMSKERDVLHIVLDHGEDDLYPLLTTEDVRRLQKFSKTVWEDILSFYENMNMKVNHYIRERNWTRKDLGLDNDIFTPTEKSIIFSSWENIDFLSVQEVIDYLKKHLSNNYSYLKNKTILRRSVWKEVNLNEY